MWVENLGARAHGQTTLPRYFITWHNKEIRKYFKFMGKGVDQVYFVEKWSKRHGLLILTS